jgi:subfamily B ATP-binding cassette protein MsbA
MSGSKQSTYGLLRARLWPFVAPHRAMLLAMAAFLSLEAATGVMMTYLMQPMIDRGFTERDASILWLAPLVFIGIMLARGVAIFGSTYFGQRVSNDTLFGLRSHLFSRLLHLPGEFYERNTSGQILSRFLVDAQNVSGGVSELFAIGVRDSLAAIGLAAYLLYVDWQLTLLILVVAPVLAAVNRYFGKRLRRLGVDYQEATGKLARRIQEAFDAERLIKIYRGEDHEARRYDAAQGRMRSLSVRVAIAQSSTVPVSQTVASLGVAAIIAAALWRGSQGAMSAGEFASYFASVLLLLQPLRRLAQMPGISQKIAAGLDGLAGLLDAPLERREGLALPAPVRGEIHFEQVRVQYEGRDSAALQGLDLTLAAGKHTAIVGPSGSGKSTLIKLIAGLLPPTGGRVLVDGVDVAQLAPAALRERIAYVGQEPFLFDDSVRENVEYGSWGAREEQLRTAVQDAALAAWLDSQPQSWNLMVGERGGQLSGGQRQRVAIARAFLKDAPILLLDEPTSALDAESQAAVQQALLRLTRNRTTLTVTHRLGAARDADWIVLIDEGQVVEQGTHDSLMAQNGRYAVLVRTQSAEL